MKITTAIALTLVTGRLFSNNRLKEVKEFLDKLTGSDVMEYQVHQIRDHIKPELIAQHPFLQDIDPNSITNKNVWEILSYYESKYGQELELDTSKIQIEQIDWVVQEFLIIK